VSHETLYRSLFIQARGALKKELIQHLRSKRFIRRSVHARATGHSHGQIVDAISIRMSRSNYRSSNLSENAILITLLEPPRDALSYWLLLKVRKHD